MGEYAGKSLIANAKKSSDGFKRGGRTKKKGGGCMKKDMKMHGDAAEMRADRPARKSGGSVFSAAASGTPRGKQSHY